MTRREFRRKRVSQTKSSGTQNTSASRSVRTLDQLMDWIGKGEPGLRPREQAMLSIPGLTTQIASRPPKGATVV